MIYFHINSFFWSLVFLHIFYFNFFLKILKIQIQIDQFLESSIFTYFLFQIFSNSYGEEQGNK
jgi:hypothetical protein